MRTFAIQTIYEYKKNKSPINRFSQLRDKNFLYFRIINSGFEVNLKNGKIKSTDFYHDKSNYIALNNYYINYENKTINVKNDNGITLFSKELFGKDKKTFIINEKEGLFSALSFQESCYSMNLYIFKIDKNND